MDIAESTRKGRVRGANLPQEYELSRFIQNIANPHPSWNTSTPACDWSNVYCDVELHVKKIYWRRMKLAGLLQWNYLCRTTREFTTVQNDLSGGVPLDTLPSPMTEFVVNANAFSGELDLSHLPNDMDTLTSERQQF